MSKNVLTNRNMKIDWLKNISENDMRKNYIFVSICYHSLSIPIVEKSQAFTLRDLFVFVGSNICLPVSGNVFRQSFRFVLFAVSTDWVINFQKPNEKGVKKLSEMTKKVWSKENDSYEVTGYSKNTQNCKSSTKAQKTFYVSYNTTVKRDLNYIRGRITLQIVFVICVIYL